MNDERASVLERLTLAAAGGGDAEVVRALGGAEIGAGLVPRELERLLGVGRRSIGGLAAAVAVGAQLARLQSGGQRLPIAQAQDSFRVLVARLNMARSWRLTDPQIDKVARGALQLHLDPVCPDCHGRRYEVPDGAPALSAIVCPRCNGTGQRPYPRRQGDKVEAVLSVLAQIQGLMEKAVARRVG